MTRYLVAQAKRAPIMTRPNPDPLRSALEAVEFRGQQGKCPLCAGWMMSAYGETPGKHTKDCLIGIALASPQGRETAVPMPVELTDEQADAALRATAVWLEVKGSQLTVNREKMKARYRSLVKFIALKSSAPDAWRAEATAPKDGTAILGVWWANIYAGREPEPKIGIVCWAGGWTPHDREITHWQPLPVPPAAEKEG